MSPDNALLAEFCIHLRKGLSKRGIDMRYYQWRGAQRHRLETARKESPEAFAVALFDPYVSYVLERLSEGKDPTSGRVHRWKLIEGLHELIIEGKGDMLRTLPTQLLLDQ
jgi:hypothetical protein